MFHFITQRIKAWLGIHSLTSFVFVFRGWNDSQAQATCGGSVDTRDEEIRAKRSGPAHPPGVWEITSSGEAVTTVGAKIRVLVDPKVITVAAVQTYLTQIGIDAVPEHA